MLRSAILVVHVTCGTLGLVVGPLAMLAPKRRGRHTRLGLAYQTLVAGLCVTALGLVVFHPGVWPLAVIAVLTEAAALAGWWLQRRRPPGWLAGHIACLCGSYVSFVTAFLVVSFPRSIWPWVVPTIIATPLIARRTAATFATPLAAQR